MLDQLGHWLRKSQPALNQGASNFYSLLLYNSVFWEICLCCALIWHLIHSYMITDVTCHPCAGTEAATCHQCWDHHQHHPAYWTVGIFACLADPPEAGLLPLPLMPCKVVPEWMLSTYRRLFRKGGSSKVQNRGKVGFCYWVYKTGL